MPKCPKAPKQALRAFLAGTGTRAELIDSNDVVGYFNSQARAQRSFGDLKIAFVCFPPYQNACRRVIFYTIKNLKLLRIFSRFIGFNAIFSCFFLGLHNPTAVPPPTKLPHLYQQPFPPLTTVSTHSGHCLDIVYPCLHPLAPNDSPPAGPTLMKGCHRKSPVTGEVPAGCLRLYRLFPDLMASSSLHGCPPTHSDCDALGLSKAGMYDSHDTHAIQPPPQTPPLNEHHRKTNTIARRKPSQNECNRKADAITTPTPPQTP